MPGVDQINVEIIGRYVIQGDGGSIQAGVTGWPQAAVILQIVERCILHRAPVVSKVRQRNPVYKKR